MIQKIESRQALYNTKIKIYPDGSTNTVYCDMPIFKDKYTEIHESELPTIREPLDNDEYCGFPRPDPNNPEYKLRKKKHTEDYKDEDEMIYQGNMKRAKDKIFDIVMCNKWDYFFTGTFDDNKIGENTPDNLMKPIQDWLKNQTKRKGLAYVLVAEYSPLNHRIHFHGLLNDRLALADSGRVLYAGKSYKPETLKRKHIQLDECKTVYNVTAWSDRFGYTTAIPVSGEPVQLARYITKYITKDNDKIFGKFYWSSRNIIREPEIVYANIDDFDSIPQPEHTITGCNFKLKYDCYFEN